ncbi:MAG: hypothetical protein V2I65_15800 [Paracoccaceae bacterium]|jgi:hypothetical protein|nr:hypothetical protein [Paracoccaceae bacterium]
MILSRLKAALARRRRGAVALVAVAGMVPVAGMLTASMNSSQMIDDRRATQDAADAIGRMHGVWSARSMNIIAMNSVTETQLLTVALGSESLNGTLIEQQIAVAAALGHIGSHAAQKCKPKFKFDPWPIICGAWHGLASIPAIQAQVTLLDIGFDYDPAHGIEVARRGLAAIEGMNRALIERFPRAVHEIGEDYADVLEIDEFHFDDPCDTDLARNCESGRTRDGMALPVEEGDMTTNLARCFVMNNGTTTRSTGFHARGFDLGQGPLDHDGSTSVRDFINDETGVGDMLHEFKDAYDNGFFASRLPHYYHSFATLGAPTDLDSLGSVVDLVGELVGDDVDLDETLDGIDFDSPDWFDDLPFSGSGVEGALEGLELGSAAGWTEHPDGANLQGEQQPQDDNSFTRRYDAKLATLCAGIGLGLDTPPLITGFLPVFETTLPTAWKLPGIGATEVFPPIDPEQMPEEFQILALAQREQSTRLGSNVFTDHDTPHNSYGQTGLFNPDGADIYSANWRYRLMESMRLGSPGEVADRMSRRAPAEFADLVDTLRAINDPNSWERINAH